MESELKKCSKCGEVKARTEFGKRKANRDGLQGQCKDCISDYQSKHYQKNKDKKSRQFKVRYDAKRDEILARGRQYYRDNKDHVLARCRKYRIENADKVKENDRRRNKRKDRIDQRNNGRRAKKYSASGTHTPEQLKARFDYHGNKCVYCDSAENLHADHQIPLSRGGTNFASNMVPACATCNISKGSKTPEEFLVYQFNIAMEKLTNG